MASPMNHLAVLSPTRRKSIPFAIDIRFQLTNHLFFLSCQLARQSLSYLVEGFMSKFF
jgi:hypothetical protein